MWLRRLLILVVVFSPAGAPSVSHAQSRIDFTPHLGMYFPLIPAVDEGTPEVTMRQVSALVVGGRLAFHATKHWLLETTFDYTPSQVAVSQNDRTIDAGGGLLFASARGVLRLGPWKPKTPALQLAAGLGLINRFGRAWRDHGGTTDLAGVLGAGGRVPLGKDLPISVRFEIEDYISHVQFRRQDAGPTKARLGHDMIWSIGFEIPVNEGKAPVK